jgi:hypothetical protein
MMPDTNKASLLPNAPDPAVIGKCALAIMTKAPRAGEVKTRLCPPLTPDEAAGLNQSFLRDISEAISRAGAEVLGVGCYTPLGTEAIYHDLLPANFRLIPQRYDQLSARLIAATADLFALGFAAVCLINSDSPTVPAATFAEAANILINATTDVVLGPADDGGYYLIGMNQPYPDIFSDIAWSTSRVLEQTLQRANDLGLRIHLLPPGQDVDDREGLRRLYDELLRPKPGKGVAAAPATAKFLRTLVTDKTRGRFFSEETIAPEH